MSALFVTGMYELKTRRRCRYLARPYVAVKKYPEALSLMQHAAIHLRESRSALELLPSPTDDPINTLEPLFHTLTTLELKSLEDDLDAESTKCKTEWFMHNGGDASGTVDRRTYKKPLFFDIALNYVELNMERLQERAGRQVEPTASGVVAPQPQRSLETIVSETEKAKSVVSRAKVEEIERPLTPEPTATTAKGGLSSLLGGWWGRK